MTALLLATFFTLAFVPLWESLTEPFWFRIWERDSRPTSRVTWMQTRLILGLGVALGFVAWLFSHMRHAPQSNPLVHLGLAPCFGHGFEAGPGPHTLSTLTLGLVGMGLLLGVLFPRPSRVGGIPRPDLAARFPLLGPSLPIETTPEGAPGAYLERTHPPRVLLCGGIETLLSPEELEGILAHELAHAENSDHRTRPWILAYRRLFFFSSLAQVLVEGLLHEQECRADDAATQGDPKKKEALVRALLRLLTSGPSERGSSPAAGGASLWSLQDRIGRLRGQPGGSYPSPGFRLWPLPCLALWVWAATSDPGACTLHCLIRALP